MANPPVLIAHVLHRLYLAGAEVLAAALARRLGNPSGRQFMFLCLDEIGPMGKQLAEEGFKVVDLGRRPGVDLSVAGKIRRLVAEHRITLLHAHQYTPFFYAALSRGLGRRPRVLFTEHGRHFPDSRRPKRVLANKFFLRSQDRVTAVGRFVKQALVDNEGIAANRIEVVYNGIDPGSFTLDPEQARQARGQIRRELNIADDQPVVLQVARFHPVKDHATAIGALKHALAGVPNAVMVLVGDGELQPAIEKLVADLGLGASVRFTGVRSDIPRLMAAADVFTLSSLSEGISVTLLEAMAAGLPIAATAVGGNPEVVAHEQSGLLSPRSDAAALGVHFVRLLQDPALRGRMAAAGRIKLLATFTQESMHLRYARIYEEMHRKS